MYFQNKKILLVRYLSMSVLLCFCFGMLHANAKGKYGKIKIEGAMERDLNEVLKAVDNLHKFCLTQNEKKIDQSIRMLLENLNRAKERASQLKDQHLVKMLEPAMVALELTLNRSGENRKESLKEAFNHLVVLAKTYKLEEYKIFFCPGDKSVWMQKSSKPKNPIHPDKYGSCGKLVQ